MIIEPLTLATFSFAVILLALTPGPDLFLIVGRGLSHGRAAAMYTAIGFFLAGTIQVPMLAFGLAALVANNPLAFDLIRYAGGAYLVWRGLKMLFGSVFEPSGKEAFVSPANAMKEGFIASLVNPKGHVFMLAFLPQFVDPSAGSVTLQFILLGVIMRIVALVVETGLATFSGLIGAFLSRSAKARAALDRAAGMLIVAIGVRLFFMENAPGVPARSS